LAPILFSGEILRIGRHSDNDIALDHASVHRHHALIQRTPDREFVLVDLTAGTGNVLLLNDRRVDRSAGLRDGDRIMLGETTVTFHLGAEAPAGSLAPVASKSTNRPSRQSSRETMHAERDASDEATGRAADRVETRRLNAADRIAARRADRGRS
jgi:pSer/pThr/pTyr-binding forkhead associated (FHA) protein